MTYFFAMLIEGGYGGYSDSLALLHDGKLRKFHESNIFMLVDLDSIACGVLREQIEFGTGFEPVSFWESFEARIKYAADMADNIAKAIKSEV